MKRTRIFDDFIRVGMIAASLYFFLPHFIVNILLQVHGVSFAFTGFYWLASGALLGVAILYTWKYKHPLAQIFMIVAVIGMAPILWRYVSVELWVMNPGVFLLNGIVGAMLVLNCVFLLKNFFGGLRRKEFIPKMRRLKDSKVFKVTLLGALSWFGFISWSYIGFSQGYEVRDSGEDIRFAFWGWPRASISYFSTPNGIAEMQRYQQLDASFYYCITMDKLNGSMAGIEAVMHEYENFNLNIILSIVPINNETDLTDFTSYYYLWEINETVRALMDWIEPLSFTNFRGISFDMERPANVASQPISRDQYQRALVSFNGILDEFKSRFPGKEALLIAAPHLIFDFCDGADDHDIDIELRTISTEIDTWDYYGFMTYYISPSPSMSSYHYAYTLKNGVEQWGTKFQPWVGWWYDVNLSAGETPQIEQPGVYERTLEHVKIAKSMGVEEVVLAPTRNFIGKDYDTMLQRLDDLIAIKNGTFEPFTVPITNNIQLFNDWDVYWRKANPGYIVSNLGVLEDMLFGTPGNWYIWAQVIQFGIFIGVFAFFRQKKKKRKEKRK